MLWSDGVFWFSSRRFSSLFHRVRPRVPWGCRGAPLWCSPLPFRAVIEGARSGHFLGVLSIDSDKLWCKGIG